MIIDNIIRVCCSKIFCDVHQAWRNLIVSTTKERVASHRQSHTVTSPLSLAITSPLSTRFTAYWPSSRKRTAENKSYFCAIVGAWLATIDQATSESDRRARLVFLINYQYFFFHHHALTTRPSWSSVVSHPSRRERRRAKPDLVDEIIKTNNHLSSHT